MIVAPLKHLETTVGVLKVVAPDVDAFDEADIEALSLISGLIAAAMFHAARHETPAIAGTLRVEGACQ